MPSMIRFSAAGGRWLAPIEDVLAVRLVDDVRPLPEPGPDVVGVIDRDGTAFPVLATLTEAGCHVLVVSHGDLVAGVLADEVSGVTEIDASAIRPRPAGQSRPYVGAIHGEDSNLAFVLDVAEIVRDVTVSTGGGS